MDSFARSGNLNSFLALLDANSTESFEDEADQQQVAASIFKICPRLQVDFKIREIRKIIRAYERRGSCKNSR